MSIPALIVVAAIAAPAAPLPPIADGIVECASGAQLPMAPPDRRLSGPDRDAIRVVMTRAHTLGAAYIETESLLREAGYEPNDFPAETRSWLSIVRGDEALVGVYRRTASELMLEDLFGTAGLDALKEHLPNAQAALAHAPSECSNSYALLDAGLVNEEGALLYALRLVDRRHYLTWGMHYRYTVTEGELTGVERLHVSCETHSNSRDAMLQDMSAQFGKTMKSASFASMVMMPTFEFPTEAQMLQIVINPALFADRSRGKMGVNFWLDGRVLSLNKAQDGIDTEYYTRENPCTVAEPAP